jgi:YVTN family beta-propeller protein
LITTQEGHHLNKLTEIPIDDFTSLAVNPQTNLIYASSSFEKIFVINGSSNRVIDTIFINDTSIKSMSINPKTAKIYAVTDLPDGVIVIDVNKEIEDLPDTKQNQTTALTSNLPLSNTHSYEVKQLYSEGLIGSVAVDSNLNRIYLASNARNGTVFVFDGSNDELIGRIDLGRGYPFASIVNPETNIIYISNFDRTISAIDGNTYKIVGNIPITKDVTPYRMAIDARKNTLYVAMLEARILSIDANTNSFTSNTIITGNTSSSILRDMVFDDETQALYVLDSAQNALLTFNSSNDMTSAIKVGNEPFAVIKNTNTGNFYVAASAVPYNVGSIFVLEPTLNPTKDGDIENLDEYSAGIRVGEEPVAIGINSATNTIYVSNYKSSTVSVINGSNDDIISEIPTVYKYPSQVLISPKTNMVYVYTNEDNGFTIIDGSTNKVVGNITDIGSVITSVDDPSLSVGISQGTGKIYAVQFPNTIIQIDGKTNKIINQTTFEELVYPIDGMSPIVTANEYGEDRIYAFHSTIPQNYTLYLLDIAPNYGDDDSVSYYGSIAAAIPLQQRPLAISFDPNRELAYTVNSDTDTLSAVDVLTTLTLANVPVGKYPTAVAVDPSSNLIYVANKYNNTISVIDGTHFNPIASVKVGRSPSAIAINPQTGLVYVVNSESNTISIIDSRSIATSPNRTNPLVGAIFSVSPSNKGHIICDNKEVTTGQYVRVTFQAECRAEAIPGFRFSSWTEELGQGATKTIEPTSLPSTSNYNLGFVSEIFGVGQDYASSPIYRILGTGNFIINFEEIPPPIPQEQLIALYSLSVPLFTAWVVPNLARSINSRFQRKKTKLFLTRLEDMQRDGGFGATSLSLLRQDVTEEYSRGKISDLQYDILTRRIKDMDDGSAAAGELAPRSKFDTDMP